jgi:hypothetical protein
MDPQLLEACRQFEAVMIRPLIDSMGLGRMHGLDAGSDADGGDGGGADELLHSLFTDALALALARDGGLGIGRELAQSLARLHP